MRRIADMDKSAIVSWLGILDNWALVCIAFVAIGVVGEFVVHFLYSRATQRLETLTNQEHQEQQTEIARLNNDTERLKADNLTLQRVMLPRRLSIIGFDEAPKAPAEFADIRFFAGTEAWTQVASDDEAQTLANDISFILRWAGWKSRLVGQEISHVPSRLLPEGINVLSPNIEKAPHAEPTDPQIILGRAADALARAFTSAGLGIRDIPVSHAYLLNKPDNPPLLPYFNPPLTVVFVEVGPRPIATTLRLMERDRIASKP